MEVKLAKGNERQIEVDLGKYFIVLQKITTIDLTPDVVLWSESHRVVYSFFRIIRRTQNPPQQILVVLLCGTWLSKLFHNVLARS